MRFGAFCPFPLPLGGDWTAAQHARMANDVGACKRTRVLARLTFTKAGAVYTIHAFSSIWGNGVALAPTPTSGGTGSSAIVLSAYTDPHDARRSVGFALSHVKATGHGSTAVVANSSLTGSYSLSVETKNTSGSGLDAKVTVTIYGRETARIADYDGALDKQDSASEGDIPHAWTWYQTYTGMLGDGFNDAMDTVVHCRKLALARSEMGRTRAAERLANNALPETADERLEMWAGLQGVPHRGTDSRHDLRLRCAAKFKLSSGPTATNVDNSVSQLLGAAYVKSWRQEGADLANPPNITYWPGVTPGPSAYDLGGGAWISERRNLVIEVVRPAGLTDADYLYLVNVQLFRLLDDMLPSTATFNWAEDVTTGFLLDVSHLDYTGIVP